MEIFEQTTCLINLEALTPDELGLLCYALEKALHDVKEDDILHVGGDVNYPFYLPPENATELLEKLKKTFTRDEMCGRGNVNPNIIEV